ncbi:MAG TPA: Na+/H+ antiporter NhaA [Hanamia sp.]|nr:Na+/H+ antiporter NhaA [Hanamia sp.]
MKSLKQKPVIATVFERFVHSSTSTGIVLVITAIIAIVWVNSPARDTYFSLWQQKFTIAFGKASISKPLILWINDGLMAVFFFVVGLEIKREIIAGHLSTWKNAAMPVFAALGGMVVPALTFTFFNYGKPSSSGWGIPMATDIAFSLGILAMLGKKVPLSLKVFLMALAIVDDLGAVLVIAFFYSSKIVLSNIALGALFLGLMIVMNLLGVRNKLTYAITGILGIWLAFLLSGVHPTIAGVLAAFAIPANRKIDKTQFNVSVTTIAESLKNIPSAKGPFLSHEEMQAVGAIKENCKRFEPPLQALESSMNRWVYLLIMPVFALSNAGVVIDTGSLSTITNATGMGIILGLVLGKPFGIVLFSWIAHKTGLASIPEKIKWAHIWGIGLLAGIGFTMSLFIANLDIKDSQLINGAKMSILIASVIASLAGYLILKRALGSRKKEPQTPTM